MITIDMGWIKYINIAVIVLYLFFFVRGARRGFILQILSALGSLVSFLGAWRYCEFASGYYNLWPKNLLPMSDIPQLAQSIYKYMNQIVWFVVLFVVFRLLFIIIEKLCGGLSELPVIKEISTILGAMLGLVTATIWVIVIATVMNLPIIVNGRKAVQESFIGLITDTVSREYEQLAGPLDTSSTIGRLYEGITEYNDQDMDMISEWLSDHGIEPVDQQEAAAEPNEETSEGTKQ